MSEKLIMTSFTEPEIKRIFKEAIKEAENEKAKKADLTTIYSINQVAKMLHVSHTTVKGLISDGILKTTSDNRRVPAWSVNEYLQNKKEQK